MYTDCMAHIHKKMKKGRPYYYIREIKRVDGKPKVVSQLYLGSPENIAAKFRGASQAAAPVKLRVEEFGALFMALEMERQLDTIGLIDSRLCNFFWCKFDLGVALAVA